MEKLHVGKLIAEAKTTITESMEEHLHESAKTARCTPSDIQRDALYMYLTGLTYADHVANDRRRVMANPVRQQSDSKDEK